ncbi:hypothetical protein [Acuticoccus kandeliae]|uniref:hypothetical protein n=1 Tax=Acuticoccus kandeliae TaxID=2073160 RepID=UPI0013005AC1|nr:hypothetical protein [Acuticoccus kandeliae]
MSENYDGRQIEVPTKKRGVSGLLDSIQTKVLVVLAILVAIIVALAVMLNQGVI